MTREELEAKLAEHGVTLKEQSPGCFNFYLHGDFLTKVLLSGKQALEGFIPLVMERAFRELTRRQRIVEREAASEMREAITLMLAQNDCPGTLATVGDPISLLRKALAAATYTPERWKELQTRKDGS